MDLKDYLEHSVFFFDNRRSFFSITQDVTFAKFY
jgi:hypothetical protein